MNKLFVLFIISLLAIGGVLAAGSGAGSGEPKGQNAEVQTQVTMNNPEAGQIKTDAQQIRAEIKEQVQTQEGYKAYVSSKGEAMQIREENGFGLKVGQIEAESEMPLMVKESADGDKIHVNLSNGRNAEIKVMPSTASEAALERLGLKVCVPENCTIELKEVGRGDEAEPAYEVETETEGKFLGLFKTKTRVRTQVSAETGEILKVKTPFLTKVKMEKPAKHQTPVNTTQNTTETLPDVLPPLPPEPSAPPAMG